MNHIDDYFIHERLPESLNHNNVQEVAKVVDDLLHAVDRNVAEVLIYPAIDRLESDLVNALAIQMHCDFYDDTLPIDVRRNLVKNSIAWHRIKGTPAAVEQMIQTVYQTGVVQEWFEYEGQPYCFRVMLGESEISLEKVKRLLKMIEASKNVRSWLDALCFEKNTDVSIFFGTVMGTYKQYHLRPRTEPGGELAAEIYWGSKTGIYKSVRALPRYASDSDLRADIYTGAANDGYVPGKLQQRFTEGGELAAQLFYGADQDVYNPVHVMANIPQDTAVSANLKQGAAETAYTAAKLQQQMAKEGDVTISLKIGGNEIAYKAVSAMASIPKNISATASIRQGAGQSRYTAASVLANAPQDTEAKAELPQSSKGTIYKTVHLSAKL